jgi:hypothetical protein
VNLPNCLTVAHLHLATIVLVAALAVQSVSTSAAPASPRTLACAGCDALADRVDLFGSDPVLLQSYEPLPGGQPLMMILGNVAFVYDNALAIIALVACQRIDQARQLGDALVTALASDRFYSDGRIRNGYAAGPVRAGTDMALPGYWDHDKQIWREDAYQVSTATGNVAWAALALLNLNEVTGDSTYLSAAQRMMKWVNTLAVDDFGPGGFRGGYFGSDTSQQRLGWKSTEQNVAIYASNRWLADDALGGDWKAATDHAERFINAMWIADEGRFLIGTLDDGMTLNLAASAIDAQVLPLLAIPEFRPKAGRIFDRIEQDHRVDGGFDFDTDRDGIWTEGTAQAALAMQITGFTDRWARSLEAISYYRVGDGLIVASSVNGLTTGLAIGPDSESPDFVYYRLPHIGATSWMVLAATGWNPFARDQRTDATYSDLLCPPIL